MNKRFLTTAASTFAIVLALGATAEALGLGGLGGLGGGGGGGSGAGSHGNAGANARGTARGAIGVGASVGRGGVKAGAKVGGLGVGAEAGRSGIDAGISAGSRSIGASIGEDGVSTSSSGFGSSGADENGNLGNGKLSAAQVRRLIRQARSPDMVQRREAQRVLAANGISMNPGRNSLARVDINAGATTATATLDNRTATRGRIADVKLKSGNAVNTRASIGNRNAAPGVGSVAQADADALDGTAKAGVSVGDRAADRGNVADVTLGAGDTANARASIGNENAAPGVGSIAQVDATAVNDTANATASVGENNADRGNIADVSVNAAPATTAPVARARLSLGNRSAAPGVGSIAQLDANALDAANAAASVGENNLDRGNIADVTLGAGDTANARASVGNENAAPGVGSIAQVDANAGDAANAAVSVGDNEADRGNVADVSLGTATPMAMSRLSIGNPGAAPDEGSVAQLDAGLTDAATADISVGRSAAVEPDGSTTDGVSADIGLNATDAPVDASANVVVSRSSRIAPNLATSANLSVGAPATGDADVSAGLNAAPDEGTASLSAAAGTETTPAATAALDVGVNTPAAAPSAPAAEAVASVDIGLGLGAEDGTPAAPGTGIPGTPGTPATVAGLSSDELAKLEKRCAAVAQSPEKYAKSVVTLCESL
ncbi:hypothetical protein IZ6_31550 [Terrihabitans soli]|uniref:Uncharacterized protein n=1 Tax=Terrihabitans soli TaxID=708113 RepID=A0A6S6QZ94_9HYPH|nr:hypothetical protein [Terrihabitans soli]BCJ92420.1 hypothetical protein IZ6_31550 [Terrihabitans soli]